MRTSCSPSFLALLFTFGACQSAPAPAEHLGEPAVFGSQLTQLIAAQASASIEQDDTVELEARLAALTQRLDELLLIARMPAHGASAVADAASRRGSAAADESIAALCEAIEVVDRKQRLCVDNIAHVNTVGYRRQELGPEVVSGDATEAETPRRELVRGSMAAGMLRMTERSLDVAIDGEGCFAVVSRDGPLCYTRAGTFQLDTEGRIVTSEGLLVHPGITIPYDAMEIGIDTDGTVRCLTAGIARNPVVLGAIELVRFANPDGLESVDGVILLPTEASGAGYPGRPGEDGRGLLRQRYVEVSNVSLQREVVELQLLRKQRTELRRALAGFGVFVR